MKDTILELLDQITEAAEHQENLLKQFYTSQHKGSKTLGEGFVVFHLRKLRELLIAKYPTSVVLGNKKMEVSLGERAETTDFQLKLKEAYQKGYDAAFMGQSTNSCPYAEDSAERDSWTLGLEEGAFAVTM